MAGELILTTSWPHDRLRLRTQRRWPDRLALAVLALVALIAALTFRDYGLGWDDFTHAQYGDLLLSLYARAFATRARCHFVNLYLYGGGFDMAGGAARESLCRSICSRRGGCSAPRSG